MDHGRQRPILVAAILLMLLGIPPASANWSGTTGLTGCGWGSPVNTADGGTHWFHYIDLRSQVSSAVNYSRAYNLDPTDLVTGYDSSLDSATDVIVRDQDYVDYCGITWHSPTSGGTIGLATCDSRTGLKCEQHTVRFDLSYIANATTSEERGLACHELGHSVGLTHRDSECGCMKSSAPMPAYYTDHDNSHLKGAYREIPEE